MAKNKKAGAQASGPRAYAAGDEVRSLIGREATIAEGATGTVEEVRENTTVLAIRTDDGDCRWLLADEEVELSGAAAEPAEPAAEEEEETATPAAEEEEDEAVAITSIAQLAQRYPALVGQVRQQAVRGERARVVALCALDPRAITAPLKLAIEGGHTTGATARALLEASRRPGADALAAIVEAEATLDAPTPQTATGEAGPSDATKITSLLNAHTRRGRARKPNTN